MHVILLTNPNGSANYSSSEIWQIIIDGVVNPAAENPITDDKEVEHLFEVLDSSDQIIFSNYCFDFWVTCNFILFF